MNLTFKQQILGVCFLWSLMLVVTGGAALYSQELQRRSQENLEHSKSMVQNYNVLLRMMLGLEDGVRGYFLSGDESRLESFEQNEGAIDQRIQDYKGRAAEASAHAKRFDRLLEIKKTWIDSVSSLIEDRKKVARNAMSYAEFIARFKANRSGADVEDFAAGVHEALADENANVARLDRERASADERARFLLAIVVPLTIGAGLMLMIFIVHRVHRAIRRLVNSLSNTATAMDGASRSMLSNATSLAASNTQTSSSTQETATAMAQIHTMTVNTNTSSKNALDTTVDCLQLAIKGQEAVTTVRTSIEDINQYSERMMLTVADNNAKLTRISDLMEQINLKTNVINDIVFQTKLLSFNASVEAARAGEHGKGFAVVAEEIGSLAKMSGEAAREISLLLADSSQQVQNIVKETTSSMDAVAGEVKAKITAGTSMSTKGHELITELLQGVSSVHEIMNGICQACTEQDAGITQVNQAIHQIEDSVHNQVSLANRYASTAEQLQEQSQKIDQQIATLRDLFGNEREFEGASHAASSDDGITWTDDAAPAAAA